MSNVPLSVQKLTKRFEAGTVNEKLALDGLSLEVPAGQFVTVLGSNGSGKSTLFNAILGKIFPDSGKILLGEEDVTRQKDYRRALNIGCLYQNPLRGTAPSMTIEENLALAYLRTAKHQHAYFSRTSKADRAFFRDQLARLDMGLEDRMRQPVGLLSGGQRQALTLLMATLVTPKLLLLDEHTAALDPATAEAQGFAVSMAATVGTVGTVLFYGTATINLIWQHMGLEWVKKGQLKKLYLVDMVLPWISHILCSFIPTFIICKVGVNMVDLMKAYLPMDGIAMKTLFTVGSLLPAVGIAILLKQVATKPVDLLTFVFGFTLAACMGLNLIAASVVGGFFAVFSYRIKLLSMQKPVAVAAGSGAYDDDEEEI